MGLLSSIAPRPMAQACSYNDVISPFDKPWDLSQKADQDKAASDHICFDVSVATATTFMELLKDKSDYYCWSLLMSVPLNGSSTYNNTSNQLGNSDIAMKVNIKNCVNLLTQWTKEPTAKCQHFAQWYNGADRMRLDATFESNPTLCKVITLDCNDNTNKGLVCPYKVQLRIINQLILHVLKHHLTTSFYKSFLAHQHNKKTGNQVNSGLILMCKMLNVCKPETIVEARHLEKELNTIALWPTHENNFRILTTHMMTVLQEIYAKTGKHLYTDQRFITNLFHALESSPSEKFSPSLTNSRASGSWKKYPIQLRSS
jgi:hypothetical protein